MSEYQYYEFAAIDEPLTEQQMKGLRALSTRAEITSTSFVNEYQWGDFKGDPRKLIVDCFDAFLHYANWGTLWCMFRLPKSAVDVAAMKRFNTEEGIDVSVKGKYAIVDICFDDEPGTYEFPFNCKLARLISARNSLLEGNLCPLYVAWLGAVQRYLLADDNCEPCAVSEIGPLDAGAMALANFFNVDDELVKAALGKAAGKKLHADKPNEIAKWARSLPQKEKDDLLAAFIAEPANVVRSKLVKQFRASHSTGATSDKKAAPRTAVQLREAAGIEESHE